VHFWGRCLVSRSVCCYLLSPMCVVLRISLDVIRFPALNLFSCLQGIYVQDIVTGGSVWKNGIIQVFAG
jgi:hypothetical protein